MYPAHVFRTVQPSCYRNCIQIECKGADVANMSIRKLDDRSLTRPERLAALPGGSLHTLVVRPLQGTDGVSNGSASLKFDDLNALGGTWSAEEAQGFESKTAAFSWVDANLWK